MAIAGQPAVTTGGSTICTSVPAKTGSILDVGVATVADIQAFHKAVISLQAELNVLCKQDKISFKILNNKVKNVVFEMAAGADEPTAYLNNGQLVVEFYGGPLDARSFRQMVKKVLLGRKIPQND
jgi:hypothetical protein